MVQSPRFKDSGDFLTKTGNIQEHSRVIIRIGLVISFYEGIADESPN